MTFMRKPFVLGLAVWIVAVAAASYIRLYPLWGHIWSPINEQATMLVILNLKKTFLGQIHQQYPQMPFDQAEHLASMKLNQTLHDDKTHVQAAIEKVNRMMSQKIGKPEPVYLLEADPFYF